LLQGWKTLVRQARGGEAPEFAAEVQAFFPVGAVGCGLAAQRKVAVPRAAAGRHGDLHLRGFALREEGAGVRDEAIDQRGVDAVVHGVEEAVAAGGGVEVAGHNATLIGSAVCAGEGEDIYKGQFRREIRMHMAGHLLEQDVNPVATDGTQRVCFIEATFAACCSPAEQRVQFE
jgi:hypothetical protein